MPGSHVTSAPGRLELIRRFVNTYDVEDDVEALRTPDDLAAWLHAMELTPRQPGVRPADLRRAVAFREALRAAMAANHDREPVPAHALAVINDTAERARLVARLVADGRWTPQPQADGVDGALGALVAIVAESMADGTWTRLKVCVNDACQWGFYDTSRARTGRWCSMQLCGNRAKQQAWRARQ